MAGSGPGREYLQHAAQIEAFDAGAPANRRAHYGQVEGEADADAEKDDDEEEEDVVINLDVDDMYSEFRYGEYDDDELADIERRKYMRIERAPFPNRAIRISGLFIDTFDGKGFYGKL